MKRALEACDRLLGVAAIDGDKATPCPCPGVAGIERQRALDEKVGAIEIDSEPGDGGGKRGEPRGVVVQRAGRLLDQPTAFGPV